MEEKTEEIKRYPPRNCLDSNVVTQLRLCRNCRKPMQLGLLVCDSLEAAA